MTVVDVGANVGLFTVIAARLVGLGGPVWRDECAPDLLAILRRNVAPTAAGRRHRGRQLPSAGGAVSVVDDR
jgi:FkbM family methyltransferase